METPKMYTRASKFSDFYTEIMSLGACTVAKAGGAAPPDFFDPILQADPSLTFGEVMDLFLSAGPNETREAWAIWALETVGHKCDGVLRRQMLSKISDPMKAYKVLRKMGASMSNREKGILRKKYVGILKNVKQV